MAIYLPDADFITFFQAAGKALRNGSTGSFMVLKENVLEKDLPPVPDVDDASVTRSDAHLQRLWAQAGIDVVKFVHQTSFPTDIFPVFMYALRPSADGAP